MKEDIQSGENSGLEEDILDWKGFSFNFFLKQQAKITELQNENSRQESEMRLSRKKIRTLEAIIADRDQKIESLRQMVESYQKIFEKVMNVLPDE